MLRLRRYVLTADVNGNGTVNVNALVLTGALAGRVLPIRPELPKNTRTDSAMDAVAGDLMISIPPTLNDACRGRRQAVKKSW